MTEIGLCYSVSGILAGITLYEIVVVLIYTTLNKKWEKEYERRYKKLDAMLEKLNQQRKKQDELEQRLYGLLNKGEQRYENTN